MTTRPVDLWTISLREARLLILSEGENARARRLRSDEDRRHWTRARSALRTILSGYAGVSPESLHFVYGSHGKPALSPGTAIEFNLSHAGEWALIVVARSAPVGVDIERIRPNIDITALLRRLGETAPAETNPYQAWTRREARSKAVGGALFDSPSPEAYAVNVDAPEGYAAAVAMLGYEPQVTMRSPG